MRISHHRENFEQTVRDYSADLYRYAHWLCRDRHLAEDIVQESFARAWKAWSELRELAQAKAWLMTIVRNECMRAFSHNRQQIEAEEEMPAVPSVESGVETAQLVALLPLSYR